MTLLRFALRPLGHFSLTFNNSVNFHLIWNFYDTPPAFRASGVPSKNFHRLRLLKAH
jgi:hypothetical protein